MNLIEKARKQVKRLTDLGITHHSNTSVGEILTAHAKKVKDKEVRSILEEMAVYINDHPEKCYPDFQAEFRAKYGRRPEVMKELIEAARPYKRLLKEFARVRKDDFPELEWNDN